METIIISLTNELLSSYTTQKLSKVAVQAIISLYNDHKDELIQLMEDGFDDDFSDINFSAWFKFIIEMIMKTDNFKKLSGKEKKQVVMELCFIFIRKELDISDDIKELLITLLQVTLPQIIDKTIEATKKLHTFTTTVMKKLCC